MLNSQKRILNGLIANKRSEIHQESPKGANVLCFLSSLHLLASATTAVFIGSYLSYLYSWLIYYRRCGLANPYDGRGFVGPKRKLNVRVLIFNSKYNMEIGNSCSPGTPALFPPEHLLPVEKAACGAGKAGRTLIDVGANRTVRAGRTLRACRALTTAGTCRTGRPPAAFTTGETGWACALVRLAPVVGRHAVQVALAHRPVQARSQVVADNKSIE
jgi:hypothetical protein